jgi:hypothetical protein
VIYGATGTTTAPQAPVHLAGNTRIDGAISFNATTNADITRTNLGLGWSALTNTNAANDLLGIMPDGQIVYNGTNPPYLIDQIILSAKGNFEADYIIIKSPTGIEFSEEGPDLTAITRTNLKIPWIGLTNTNASGFRSSLGLNGGITTNRTFVSYNGTNYTTNTVTISNGIITGWTQ